MARKIILSIILIMSICLIGCKSISEKVENIDVENITETSTGENIQINKEEKEDEVVVLNYESIISQLNQKMENKEYNSKQKELLTNILNELYENYDSYEVLYRFANFPNKEEYIIEHFINPIDYIGNLYVYDYYSEEAKEMLNNGFAKGYVSYDSSWYISYIYNDTHDDNELLFHEINHIQNKDFLSKTFVEYEYNVFVEGHASFHQQFVNNLFQPNAGSWIVSNSKGNEIHYEKNNSLGYLQYYNIYANLLLVAGYDTMEEVTRTSELSVLKNTLLERYGKDISDKIFDTIYYITSEEVDKDEKYKGCIEFQNAIIDSLYVQLENLQSKNEVEEYIEFYKAYKYFLLPIVFENGIYSKDITYETFDIYKLEERIIEKSTQYNIVEKDYDENLKKAILKAILYNQSELLGLYQAETYTVITLPLSYKEVKINKVNYENGKYYVNINYQDKVFLDGVLNVDIEYILDENLNVLDIYNTKYIFD